MTSEANTRVKTAPRKAEHRSTKAKPIHKFSIHFISQSTFKPDSPECRKFLDQMSNKTQVEHGHRMKMNCYPDRIHLKKGGLFNKRPPRKNILYTQIAQFATFGQHPELFMLIYRPKSNGFVDYEIYKCSQKADVVRIRNHLSSIASGGQPPKSNAVNTSEDNQEEEFERPKSQPTFAAEEKQVDVERRVKSEMELQTEESDSDSDEENVEHEMLTKEESRDKDMKICSNKKFGDVSLAPLNAHREEETFAETQWLEAAQKDKFPSAESFETTEKDRYHTAETFESIQKDNFHTAVSFDSWSELDEKVEVKPPTYSSPWAGSAEEITSPPKKLTAPHLSVQAFSNLRESATILLDDLTRHWDLLEDQPGKTPTNEELSECVTFFESVPGFGNVFNTEGPNYMFCRRIPAGTKY